MLKELYIKNIAVIEELKVEFGTGFQVLTGETGAGKSILVEAIGLILGEKASADLVRDGSDEALVEAVFDMGDSAQLKAVLRSLDMNNVDDEDELIIRRSLSRAGKSKVFINHQRGSIRLLQSLSFALIDFTGQHEQIRLLDANEDINIVDSFLDDQTLLSKYVEHYENSKGFDFKLKQLIEAKGDREQRLDWINFQLKEFEKLKIEAPEEEQTYKEQRSLLKNQKLISDFSGRLTQSLTDSDQSCLNQVKDLRGALSRKTELQEMYPDLDDRLEALQLQIEDVSFEVSRSSTRFDRSTLGSIDDIESQLYVLEQLKRKFGPEIHDVLQKQDDLKREKVELESVDDLIHQMEKKLKDSIADLANAGQNLSTARQNIKNEIEGLVQTELKHLLMPDVKFIVEINRPDKSQLSNFDCYKPNGIDDVRFMLSPNPGLSPRPLAKIASGGETSRIFLALKQVLARRKMVSTFIFDEIDTGISGAAVELVGHKLKSLAGQRQVFCITHHAQIAAQADRHFFVHKDAKAKKTITRVKVLKDDERVHEVARLMGGVEISKKNLSYAQELIGRKAKMN